MALQSSTRPLPVIVGVDVGGTNTDAVVVSKESSLPYILSSAKSPTTADVYIGVTRAVADAINNAREQHNIGIVQVNVGTTHFVNAVVQRKGLVRVAVLRLCGSASRGLPPFTDIPKDLHKSIFGGYYMINGGYEFDGSENSSVDLEEVRKCLDDIESKQIKNVVVCGIFSSVKPDQELLVRNFIKKTKPDFSVTLSHEIGHIGLLKRENASLLNECLKPLCHKTIHGFSQALKSLELHCPLYLTQNDGTIITSEKAECIPVCTFSSGPTNSMRGAAFLSGLSDAVVIDIGGTTTDVGVLVAGFPREASSTVNIGGIRTNFRMPDVTSIGLGGGSYVEVEEDCNSVVVGPLSSGYNIRNECYVFASTVDSTKRLTTTDIAVASGLCKIGNPSNVQGLNETVVRNAMLKIKEMVEKLVDKMKTSKEPIPIVLVGGGSILIDANSNLKGASSIMVPDHADVANALGAAVSQVSSTFEYVVSLEDHIDTNAFEYEISKIEDEQAQQQQEVIRKKYLEAAHAKVMADACEKTKQAAISSGASESTVVIVEKMDTPLSYLPGCATRLKVKAVGDLVIDTNAICCVNRRICVKASSKDELADIAYRKQVKTSTGQDIVRQEKTDEGDRSPIIDQETKEWIVSERDIECLTIGAGILGCGGGGSPYIGRLLALKALEEGKQMRIIDHRNLNLYGASGKGLIVLVAFMGAPVITDEKAVNKETVGALTCMQDVYKYGGFVNGTLMNTDDTVVKHEDGITYIDDYKSTTITSMGHNSSSFGDDQVIALMSAEIGGMNAIEPLLVAAELNLPVVDCDGMGRAFPELQMFTPFIYGCKPYPSTLADDKGRRAVVLHVDSSKRLEDHFRKVVVEMGCSGGVVLSAFTQDEISKTTVHNSLSRAWFIGDAVMRARAENNSPIDAIIKVSEGKLLMTGKVVMVRRETLGGFNKGYISVEDTVESANTLKIEFQNENLVAQLTNVSCKDEVVACVPDLITVVDTDSGEPVATGNVRYGLRVSVLVLPASRCLKTDCALRFVGPQAFGYSDVQFKPCAEYDEQRSVIKEFL